MKKILIVEDEVMLASVLSDRFKREGYEVYCTRNGEEGLDSALKDHPDLILLDIIMPVMDGMTMLERLRHNAWGKQAKVIILTNLSDSDKLTKSKAEEVRGYFIKSDWKMDEIVKKVNEELKVPSK